MKMTRSASVVLLFFAHLAMPVLAAEPSDRSRPMAEMHGDCSNFKIDVKKELKTFDEVARSFHAARSVAPQIKSLTVNQVAEVRLAPQASVRLPVKPEKIFESKGETNAGLASFKADKDGIFKFSLGTKIWIDLLDANQALVPAKRFEMQTACPSIFKVVEYNLKSGELYTVQLSSSGNKSVKVLVSQ